MKQGLWCTVSLSYIYSSIPEGSLLVTADVVGLYPSIPHELGLEALKKALDNQEVKPIPTKDLVNMAEFVLKNNYFEFNGECKQQISGTATGTKFACICMHFYGPSQNAIFTNAAVSTFSVV